MCTMSRDEPSQSQEQKSQSRSPIGAAETQLLEPLPAASLMYRGKKLDARARAGTQTQMAQSGIQVSQSES